jgi:hypothetical protein
MSAAIDPADDDSGLYTAPVYDLPTLTTGTDQTWRADAACLGMNTDDLIAETAYIKSEDVRQEYLTLRLEGHTTQQATAKSGPADPLATRNKQRGPLVNDQRPIVSDYREYTNLISYTLDNRTDHDRDIEWSSMALATQTVNDILDQIPPLQAEAIRTIYGFGTGQPMNWKDAAKHLGIKTSTITSRMQEGRKNMQKIVLARTITATHTDKAAA